MFNIVKTHMNLWNGFFFPQSPKAFQPVFITNKNISDVFPELLAAKISHLVGISKAQFPKFFWYRRKGRFCG